MASAMSTKMDHTVDSRVFQEKIKVPLSPLNVGASAGGQHHHAFKGRHSYFHSNKKKEPVIAKPVIPFDLSVCCKRTNITMPAIKQDLGQLPKECKGQGGGPKIRKPLNPSLHLKLPFKAFSNASKESPSIVTNASLITTTTIESKSPITPNPPSTTGAKKEVIPCKPPPSPSNNNTNPVVSLNNSCKLPRPSSLATTQLKEESPSFKQNLFTALSGLENESFEKKSSFFRSHRSKSNLKRPTSMLVLPTQVLGTTTSRSRPPSPSYLSSGRRTPSPGSVLDPVFVETVKQRIRKVQRARLYLLQQPGPHSFLVAADSPEHKYKVIIGPQNCTCGKSPHCIHVLFVMLRVFQVRSTDPKLFSRTLKNFEVEELIKRYQIRRKKQVNSNPASNNNDSQCLPKKNKNLGNRTNRTMLKTSASESCLTNPAVISYPQPKGNGNEGATEEESALCPICLLDMVEGESLVTCEQGCRNKLHHHCIAIWAAECVQKNEKILCPLCRAEWISPSFNTNKSVGRKDIGENAPNVPASVVSNRSPSCTSLAAAINPKLLKHHNLYSSSHSSSSPLTNSSSSSSSSSSITPTSSLKNSSSISSSIDSHSTRNGSHLKLPDAQAWLQVFGNEFVSSLASPNWSLREKALKWLARQAKSVLVLTEEIQDPSGDTNNLNLASSNRRLQDFDTVLETCCKIIQSTLTDPVYKVYIAALRVLRIVLAHSLAQNDSDLKKLQLRVKPIVKGILLKCAEGSRRTSQLSIATLIEMARGQAGALAVGLQTKQAGSNGLGGVEYILNCALEDDTDNPKVMKHWQWLLGRLLVVERLIEEFPHEFYLLYVQQYTSMSSVMSTGPNGVCDENHRHKLLHYQRLTTVLGFAKKALEHPHTTVNKLAHRVFLVACNLTARVPAVFSQIFDMISDLDVNIQNALVRKLEKIIENLNSHSNVNEKRNGKRKSSCISPSINNNSPESPYSLQGSRKNSLIGRNQERNLIQEKLVSEDKDSCFSRNSAQRFSGRSLSFSFENHSNSNSGKELFQSQKMIRPSYLPLRSTNCPSPGLNRTGGRDSFRNKKTLKNENEFSWKCEEDLNPSVTSFDTGCHTTPELDLSMLDVIPNEPEIVNDLIDLSPSVTLTPSCDSGAFSPVSFQSEVSTPVTPDESWNKSVAKLFVSPKTPDFEADSFPVIPGLRSSPDEEIVISMQPDVADDPNGEVIMKGSYIETVHWSRGPLLGTGAFSSCYQARDDRTGILMAVKQVSFFRNDEMEQEKVMEGIREEIIMMSKLRHPNVLRILGATEQGGHYNVFVEWMAGGSVASLLDRYGPFKEQITLKYTWQVLDGLAYLHDNQILHRDLKGANLLVDSTGHHLRIADFGAAVRMQSHSTVAGEFQGQLLGTIAFMAPEVLRGENYGRSCDVWSVGCVLIEMATAKPPWNANDVSNHLALIFKIACSNTPPPIPENLSSATQDLALQCLQVNSEKRPAAKNLLNHPCFQQCLM